MKIIVDGMGGDKAPGEIVKGVIDAVKEYNLNIIIAGKEDLIKKELEKYSYPKEKIDLLHASEVITNEDDPVMGIRRKKEASMVVGLEALAEGKADGFISAGNTGALLAGGLFIIKRIKGIKRAAITTLLPSKKGVSLLVDAGANVDSKPEYLQQFGIMGSIYMDKVMGINKPSVGLINIGAEKGKGNQLVKDTYPLLEESNINFIGNIESRYLLEGVADVMVADGFVGNVVLKLTEGVAMTLFDQIKDGLMSNIRSKLGGFLVRPSLQDIKKQLDYREYGGAPLLGTRKPVIKAHGSSDAYAIKNAIGKSIDFINQDIISIIEKNIKENKEE